ncbi:MAG: 3'-5' exonuclease [Phaeodactylibacter sp.]|uniref:3'-5' exonuclease n=1 Tax=Phaeodactylibacter sp. TaxID=1940289 RepID=UPI0032EFB478
MFNWFKKNAPPDPNAPAFWQTYLTSVEEAPFHNKTPIEEVSFVVFDTETTGLDVQKDQILSIGAVRVKNWHLLVADRLECYVHQEYSPEGKTVAVHGILPGERIDSLSEREGVRRFLAFAGGDVLVAHHAAFDVAMLNAALQSAGAGKLRNKVLDTGVLARRVARNPQLSRPGTFGLDHLCDQYRIPQSDRHTAPGDAYITALLLLKLLYRLKKRGVHTLGALLTRPRTGL